MINQQHWAILSEQIDIGIKIKAKLEQVDSTPKLEQLMKEYEVWDEQNKSFFKKGYVSNQLYTTYCDIFHLPNVYDEENSFKAMREQILSCLPRKLEFLKSAHNNIGMIPSSHLVPIENQLKEIYNKPQATSSMKKLFISHSSKDDATIKPLITLLNVIGLHDEIFYCSIPGYGLKAGENLFDGLKRELNGDIFALFMLSSNFYQSQACLCEMGAIWIKSIKHKPILIPPTTFSDMEGVFPHDIALKLNDKFSMNELKEELEAFFSINKLNPSRWEQVRDGYLVELNKILQ